MTPDAEGRKLKQNKQTTNLYLSSLDSAVNLSQLLCMVHQNFHEHDKKKKAVEGRELQNLREKAPPLHLTC